MVLRARRAGAACLACVLGLGAAELPGQDGQGDDAIPPSLPEPLSLEAALDYADEPYPTIAEAEAELDAARAEREAAMADDDVYVALEGNARYVEPSVTSRDLGNNDSSLELSVTKRLYDFGRTESQVQAAEAGVTSRELDLVDTRRRHRIRIMRRFFDVLLADLRYARDNEAMATAYVQFDRLRDRNEMGQVSDIDLLEAQTAYQQQRRRRYDSDAKRRTTRAKLALALNRPGQLPDNLTPPELPGNDRERPDLEGLISTALSGNPGMAALRAEQAAARHRLDAARAQKRPVLKGEVEAGTFARELGSNDELAAGLVLEFPLYQGRRVDAAVGRARAHFQRVQARIRRTEAEIRQAVRETWERIGVLRAQAEAVAVQRDFRELYLDRSRALYALEVRTDLGDAMVRWSEVRLRRAQTEYELALAWARLHALLGQAVEPTQAAGRGGTARQADNGEARP